jgi:hypothetical protein
MSMHRNPVGWFEIYVSDMPRAKAFYEAMLGVELSRLPTPPLEGPPLEMFVFPGPTGGEGAGCGGALCKMEGCQPGGGGGTLIYFSCADCAVEAERAGANGGQVFRPKFPIGEYGFISLIIDSEGNMIGLHSMD